MSTRPETAPPQPATAGPAAGGTGPIPRRGAQSVRRRWPARAALSGLAGLGALALLLAVAGGYGYQELGAVGFAATGGQAGAARTAGDADRLEARIRAEAPSGHYIVVDTIANRLSLKRGDEVVREAVCSTGTGGILEDPATGRRWVFETPRGTHRVQSKTRDPVWKKPDWAFIEEGLPIPLDPRERFDPYSLGDYALYLGDGYLIHGTLYQRLLGRSVTHGCVRLGDADLEAVYRAAGVGTRVYIW